MFKYTLLCLCLFLVVVVGNLWADNIVIETIAKEASNQPLEAQVYVARVIITRARERGLSYEQVCLQPKQFSCWGVKQKPRTAEELKTALKAWLIALRLDVKVNMYCNSTINPYWRKHQKVKYIKTIGKLDFFYEKK